VCPICFDFLPDAGEGICEGSGVSDDDDDDDDDDDEVVGQSIEGKWEVFISSSCRKNSLGPTLESEEQAAKKFDEEASKRGLPVYVPTGDQKQAVRGAAAGTKKALHNFGVQRKDLAGIKTRSIGINERTQHLGSFDGEEAARAFDEVAVKNHRPTNFSTGISQRKKRKRLEMPKKQSGSKKNACTVSRGGGSGGGSGSREVPVSLTCGHTFCSPCIERLAASEVADGLGRSTRQSIGLVCPLCRTKVREGHGATITTVLS